MQTLTKLEREAINDSVLKLQSIQASLEEVADNKVPEMEEINECLDSAHRSLRGALRDKTSKEDPTIERAG